MPGKREEYKRSKIANVCWFVGLAVLLYSYWLVMTNFVIRDFYDPQYALKAGRMEARMKEFPGHPPWVVMGSSRVEYGFRPGVIADRMNEKNAPMIFNFGLGGANLFRQLICLRRLVEDGMKPRRVGIEILGAVMSHELYLFVDDPNLTIRARKDELGVYGSYCNSPENLRHDWICSRFNPAYKYGIKIPNQTLAWRLLPVPLIHEVGEKPPYDKWGWHPGPSAPIPESDFRHGFEIAKNQYKDLFHDFKISPDTDRALMQILDLCKNEGIEVFLFRTPESNVFQALYTPEADTAIDSYIAKIKNQYSVPFIDARSWIGIDGFTDGHHLNATGGEKFTRRFVDELFQTGASYAKP